MHAGLLRMAESRKHAEKMVWSRRLRETVEALMTKNVEERILGAASFNSERLLGSNFNPSKQVARRPVANL